MVDDHGLVVAIDVAVMIVTVLDHDGIVAIAMVFLPDHRAVAIPIAIITTLPHQNWASPVCAAIAPRNDNIWSNIFEQPNCCGESAGQ